jgi:hypothetical protein
MRHSTARRKAVRAAAFVRFHQIEIDDGKFAQWKRKRERAPLFQIQAENFNP